LTYRIALESAWFLQPLNLLSDEKPGFKVCFQMGQLAPLRFGVVNRLLVDDPATRARRLRMVGLCKLSSVGPIA
jgi:hypothetical protein